MRKRKGKSRQKLQDADEGLLCKPEFRCWQQELLPVPSLLQIMEYITTWNCTLYNGPDNIIELLAPYNVKHSM